MAESACLMRSFSHPSDASREFREGDPMQALTESISFGRFMVEPLAWEKWSSFSRNRHLEEIEKFAKPGSVAEKKAYFEAHYRKKYVMKEAALLNTEEENIATCTIHTPECCSSISTTEPELVTEEKLFLSNEQIEEADFAVVEADSTDQMNVPTTEISISETVEASGTESSDQGLIEEKSTLLDDTKCANSMTSQEEKINDKISSSFNEKKEQKMVYSSKLLTRSRPSRLLLSNAKEIKSIPPRKGNYHAVQVKEKKPVVNSSDKKKLASRSVHMSMNFGSSNVVTSKVMSPVANSSDKKKAASRSVYMSMNFGSSNVGPSKAMSPVANSSDKKKAVSRSVHVSMNFGSSNVGTSKAMSPVAYSSDKKKLSSRSVYKSMNFGSSNVGPSKAMSPVLKQIKKIKDITASLKLQRESLVLRKTPAQASTDLKPNLSSVDFKSKPMLTSVLEESETRRTKPLQNRKTTGGSRASKSSNLHSKENTKPQAPPIACTPFRFRSEERAAKRKEKQEEQRNSNNAEKTQIHGSCKKTRTRSQSPKFTPKPLQSKTQDTKSQEKTLSNANNESCCSIKMNISRRSMRTASMLLPRKTVHENASPNIQHQTLLAK